VIRVLWPVAVITWKEGIRNKAIYGISLFALLLLGANLLVSGMMMRSAGKTAVEMALSTVSLCGLLLVFFVGINLIAKDFDRRTIYMVLSRPVSRVQYILGKFIGIALLIVSAVVFLGVFAALSIFLVEKAYPDYFGRFSWGLFLLGLGMNGVMLMLLAAITILFASISSTSFVTLVLTIITYIIGQSIGEVKALVENPLALGLGISVPKLTVILIKAAYYLFPNLSIFDIKVQVAHGIMVPASYVAWTVLYGAVYSAVVIVLASLFIRKREFP